MRRASPKVWLRRLLLMIASLALVSVAAPPAARAQTAAEKQKAGMHFTRGQDLYSDGDYQGAVVEFERAYNLAPDWRVLFNIGQVKYQLQDYPGAMRALDQYLKEGGADVTPERRALVLADVDKLRSRVAYIRIEVDEAGARVSIDDREVGISPLPKAMAVSAGRRKITATTEGAAPVTTFVDVAGGDSSEVTLSIERRARPAPNPTPARTPVPPDEQRSAEVPWAAWGVTAGLGVGSLVFGLLALEAASDFDDAKGQLTTKKDLESDRKKVLGFSITTDVLLVSTVAVAAISLYLTIDAATADDADAGGAPDGELGLVLSPTGVTLLGTF